MKYYIYVFASYAPSALAGYRYQPGYIPAGGDVGTLPAGTTLAAAETWCSNVSACMGFTFVGPKGGPSVGDVYFKNNPDYLYNATSTWASYTRLYNPCDIYADAGTPCVAAHSVVRALYGDYAGPLYQVNRTADGALFDVGVLSEGGVANAAAQDAFCNGDCLISRIYDQSGLENHLSAGPPGGNNDHQDSMVNASRAPISIGGSRVYSAFFEGGDGYRIDNTTGMAKGNEEETLYMVTSGQRFNDGCCFE
jgi:hypothetical protein